MDTLNRFYDHAASILSRVMQTQSTNLRAAAEAIFLCVSNGGTFYVVGSGHSHMIAEEFYVRAGGLAIVRPILTNELMLHDHPKKSTEIERLADYAGIILSLYKFKAGDVLLIASNSGRNCMIVELALQAHLLGVKVIGVTSLKHARSQPSRHTSGKNLCDIGDIVIDNCGETGDAGFLRKEGAAPMGATSTITGAFIAQSISILVAEEYAKQGVEPPVFVSSNIEGGDSRNSELFRMYYNV